MNNTSGRIFLSEELNNSGAVELPVLNTTSVSSSRPTPIVFWCFLVMETLLIVLGNGMLCWLFLSRRKLRSQQNFFVLSLSISDFLVGLTIAPCEYCGVNNSDMCALFCGSVLSFNMLASTINLVLIAADRYYSIMRPFHYQEVVSKSRAKIVIFIGWLTTLLLTLLPLVWAVNDSIPSHDKINFQYVVTLFVLVIVIGIGLGISYYQIVRMIQSKLKETKTKSSNPAGIKVCILVAISFFICWTPTCIIELLIASGNKITASIMNTVYFVFLMNPCLDPIMYAYYRRDFRHELGEWRKRRWNSVKKLYDSMAVKKKQHSVQEKTENNNIESWPILNSKKESTADTPITEDNLSKDLQGGNGKNKTNPELNVIHEERDTAFQVSRHSDTPQF